MRSRAGAQEREQYPYFCAYGATPEHFPWEFGSNMIEAPEGRIKRLNV